SGAKLLLTDAKNLQLATSIAAKDLNLLNVAADIPEEILNDGLPVPYDDGPAWLMFTSGSTGTPKGVWQNHSGLVQEANMYAELAGIMPHDRMALLTSCSLSASSGTLFGALLSGAVLCLFHVRSQGVERLVAWLIEKDITV